MYKRFLKYVSIMKVPDSERHKKRWKAFCFHFEFLLFLVVSSIISILLCRFIINCSGPACISSMRITAEEFSWMECSYDGLWRKCWLVVIRVRRLHQKKWYMASNLVAKIMWQISKVNYLMCRLLLLHINTTTIATATITDIISFS